jgi:17beta-estradiol 17-dehydrogenase / very-long-chain 3-oxoacyl-CoA reductase
VKDLDIGLLVNNVGVDHKKDFVNLDDQALYNLITINCVPVVMLTKTLLPLLLKRSNRSGIINLSSYAGCHPIPYLQSYSATKVSVIDIQCRHSMTNSLVVSPTRSTRR